MSKYDRDRRKKKERDDSKTVKPLSPEAARKFAHDMTPSTGETYPGSPEDANKPSLLDRILG